MKQSSSKVKFLIGKSISSESLNSIVEKSTSQNDHPSKNSNVNENVCKNNNDSLQSSNGSIGSNEHSPENSVVTNDNFRYLISFYLNFFILSVIYTFFKNQV